MDLVHVIVLSILAGTLFLLATERFKIDIIGLMVLSALIIAGLVTGNAELKGDKLIESFANRAVIAVASFFVISHGILRTGALTFVARKIAALSNGSPTRLLLASMATVLVLSAFMNNTPVVAIFVPIILGLANEYGVLPSKLLLPISYASLFGGTCTLIGTSTNLLVSDSLEKHGFEPLGMFELSTLGLVLAVIGLAYMMSVGRWLLPERQTVTSILGKNRKPEYFTEIEVKSGSAFIGKTIQECLSAYGEFRVVEVMRKEETLWNPKPDQIIREGDVLLMKGNADAIVNIESSGQVEALPEVLTGKMRFDTRNMTLAEVVLTPDSPMIGKTISDAKFQTQSRVRVIAVLRQGRHIRERVSQLTLQLGDILLVFGEDEALEELQGRDDLFLMDGVHETIVFKRQARIALSVLALVILLITTETLSMVEAAILGATSMLVTGCLSARDAYRAINWPVIILVASTISLGTAMEKTGTVKLLIDSIHGPIVTFGPYFGLAAVYVVTAILTHVVSNNSAAVLMVPIAINIADSLDCSFTPFVMCVAFAASASFSTPMSYQTNQIVYAPGGYSFRDYMRVGLPLNVLFFISTVLLIPFFWKL